MSGLPEKTDNFDGSKEQQFKLLSKLFYKSSIAVLH